MAENIPDLLEVLNEVGDNDIEVQDIEEKIKISDENIVIEGEENEVEVFRARCKLYWFSEGSWYLHAVGDLRVLKPKMEEISDECEKTVAGSEKSLIELEKIGISQQSQKHRVIMRRQDVLNLAINHHILPETNATQQQPKSIMWRCTDFSHPDDGDIGFNKTVMARFKTEAEASSFLTLLETHTESEEKKSLLTNSH
jgi:hypothetical protein